MKLPAKPPTKVQKVYAALCASGSLALLVDEQGKAEKPCWRGSIADLAEALFGPDPVVMPSTEAMAAHMDEFYSDSILDNAGIPTDDLDAAMQMYRDSEMCGSRPDFLTPRKG